MPDNQYQSLKPDNPYDLETFLKEIPGRRYVPRIINDKITPQSDLEELRDINAIVKNVQRILLIEKGTYPFDPGFGVGIYKYLFEPATNETRSKMRNEISQALKIYEPRANCSVDIGFMTGLKGFNVKINIKYKKLEKNITIPITENLLK